MARRFLFDALVVGTLVFTLFFFLPLLAVIGFSLQFGFLAFVPLAIMALAIPAVRRELSREDLHRVKGVGISWGVTVHPKHSWLRIRGRRLARIGIDDLARRFIGPVDSVQLPQKGQRFKEGDVLATLSRGDRTIPVVAPASGVVLRVNENLLENTQALQEPYSDGWVVDVKIQEHSEKMIGVSDIVSWLRDEIDRLACLTGNGTSMADGGELCDDISKELDQKAWNRAKAGLFE